MKVTVLASGSKGNITLVEKENTRILIDIGMTLKYIQENLENPKEIDGIVITHTHSDHIKGLETFIKRYKTKVYITKGMESDLLRFTSIKDFIFLEPENQIKDINLKIIHLSHDTEDIIGIIVEEKLVYITDTGYINLNHFDDIGNKHTYIFESNHDVEMLMNGPYPFYLQQRILSNKGHLSNEQATDYLKRVVGKNTKNIILAHLSENNNTEELALKEIKKEIKGINIVVAKQREKLNPIIIEEQK